MSPLPEMLTIAEASTRFDISQATLFRWLAEGILTRYKIRGKGTRIDADQLTEVMRPVPADGAA